MEDNTRRRKQNEAPYPGADTRFNGTQSQGRGYSASSSDRYRPASLNTSPSTSRSAGGNSTYSGYYQESTSSFPTAIPQSSIQYHASSYSQDQRQQQNFTPYHPELMYNVTPQGSQNNVYDSTSQFPGRQPAAIQMLSEVAAPYFQHDSTTTPNQSTIQHHNSSSSSTVYQQPQQSPQGYPGNITMTGLSQTGPEILDEVEYQTQVPGMEAAYIAYQTALKEIFQNIINGRLAEAGQSLLEVSEWLLGHVGDLGLTVDEVGLHSDRIRLWGEFNTAWLSIFQKQKDMLGAGHRIQHPQTLMSQKFINKMAKDLVRMCDVVEKHGLVDYQYGVEEEQIMRILVECLDLQESIEGTDMGDHALGRAPP